MVWNQSLSSTSMWIKFSEMDKTYSTFIDQILPVQKVLIHDRFTFDHSSFFFVYIVDVVEGFTTCDWHCFQRWVAQIILWCLTTICTMHKTLQWHNVIQSAPCVRVGRQLFSLKALFFTLCEHTGDVTYWKRFNFVSAWSFVNCQHALFQAFMFLFHKWGVLPLSPL